MSHASLGGQIVFSMASFAAAPTLGALNSLLKATSKAQVEKCLSLVFVSRFETTAAADCAEAFGGILSIEDRAECEALRAALLECVQVSLASGSVDALAELFLEKGGDVDGKLRSLVGKIVEARLAGWREASSMNRVSLPRLIDHNWALNMQRSSSQAAAINAPSVLVQLKVEEQATRVGEMPKVSNVDFELSREALATMLDGLTKIKEQLSAMGK